MSELQVYSGLMGGLPIILFSIMAGYFSDKFGRTVFMAIPFVGSEFFLSKYNRQLLRHMKLIHTFLIISNLIQTTRIRVRGMP